MTSQDVAAVVPHLVVCVGAAADQRASLQDFFRNTPADSGLAFVVLQHDVDGADSWLWEVLAAHTEIPVRAVASGDVVRPDTIYLAPPVHDLRIVSGQFWLTPHDRLPASRFPIDTFLHSLATESGPQAIVVVFAGTGADGVRGIAAIKNEGGVVVIQDASGEYGGMPPTGFSAGLADVVAIPSEMPGCILALTSGIDRTVRRLEEVPEEILTRLLRVLHERSGVDLTQYRRERMTRRIEKRMRLNRVESLDEYVAVFAESTEEAAILLREITSAVPEFFRDRPAFDVLEDLVLPPMVERAPPDAVLRVWIAGCSSGEEAYSVAMCMLEAVRRSKRALVCKVFATDIDQHALRLASSGVYPSSIETQIPMDLLERYFRREGDCYRVRRHLRQRVVFAAHNVAVDPPFTAMDLVTCRNVLRDQQAALQSRVMASLSLALKVGGVLFLGASEEVGRHAGNFEVIDRRWRLFRRRPPAPPADVQVAPVADEALCERLEQLEAVLDETRSRNTELETVNAEQRRQIREQAQLAADLDHLLVTSDIGSVFLDRQLRVRKFTPAITNVIALEARDIWTPLADCEHEMPEIDLVEVAQRVLQTSEAVEREVQMHDGRRLLLRVIPYRNLNARLSGLVMNVVDVTDIQRARESLAASEERFTQIAENISEVLWTRGADGRSVQYVSRAYERIWQRSPEALIEDANEWFSVIHPSDRSQVTQRYRNLDGSEFDLSYRIVRDDGQLRWIRDRGFPIRGERDEVVRYAGIAEDVTSHKKSEDALRDAASSLEEISIRDPLTGLVNRRGLERVLGRECARAHRSGGRLMGMLVDCDDFKAVNDEHGHAFGDEVLVEVASRLRSAVRPTDCVARIGGDEFLALLPDTRLAESFAVAERVRCAVGSVPVERAAERVRVTVSVGVAEVDTSVSTIKGLLSALQQSLKHSKGAGKNRVSSGAQVVVRGDVLEASLRSGEGFRVVAQSIRRLADEACVGWELLSRGPEGALENPVELFRTSIERGLLADVDRHCLHNCLAALDGASDRLDGVFHVNLHPATLLAFSEDAISRLFAKRALAGRICVEISEQQVVGEPGELRRRVCELRAHGVQVALDDVGFGRSSLEALIVLEPDIMKIDRSFVRNCAEDRRKRPWLERLVRVAASLGAKVVAGGIENRADLDLLREVGVVEGQGFIWDRPQSISAWN